MDIKELKTRLFLKYGMNIKIIDIDDDYDINKIYQFDERNNTLNKSIRKFKSLLSEVLYTNIYWKEDTDVINNIYASQEDINQFENNDAITFNIQINENETLIFKPAYVSGDGLNLLHYFDRSYYKNDIYIPNDILEIIIEYFDGNKGNYILNII